MPRKMYSMMTTMTDRPKSITVVLGMLSGALITAALGAFDFWILLTRIHVTVSYMNTRYGWPQFSEPGWD